MAVGQVYITPRLKRVLDLSNEEANPLKDEYISTEHIFLAISSDRSTPSARILQELGIKPSFQKAITKHIVSSIDSPQNLDRKTVVKLTKEFLTENGSSREEVMTPKQQDKEDKKPAKKPPTASQGKAADKVSKEADDDASKKAPKTLQEWQDNRERMREALFRSIG